MKSRQVGYVLMALIAVGIAGLVFRVVAAGSDEVVLEGIVQVSPIASDRVLVEGEGMSTELQRLGEAEQLTWFVDDQPVFDPLLARFWQAVTDFYDAQLVSNNPNNHERLGVIQGDAIEVSFFQERRSLQEKFIVGKWSPDVRLCYVRRAGHDETYGIPCPEGNIFNPDPDRWKNPVAASIPPNDIAEIQFTYPEEQFLLKPNEEGEWMIYDPTGGENPVDPRALNAIMQTVQIVVASGFATEEEAETLNFNVPDAMVRILTHEESATPSTRLRFLAREDGHFYLSVPTTKTVYIIDGRGIAGLLLSMAQVTQQEAGN